MPRMYSLFQQKTYTKNNTGLVKSNDTAKTLKPVQILKKKNTEY